MVSFPCRSPGTEHAKPSECPQAGTVSPRRVDGFFYGLFMDAEVLRQAGTDPAGFRRAQVRDFALRLGRRATLVPTPGARAYGMVISLTHAELGRLYGAPGLEDYRPEAVLAWLDDDKGVPALCYNLVQVPEPGERNPGYARRLLRVLERLDFPADYVESVRRIATDPDAGPVR